MGKLPNGGLPEFTYTGQYALVDDGDGNWRIKFLTSGELTFTDLGSAADGIDAFLVGGGGGGSHYHSSKGGGAGGGGGYTTNVSLTPVLGETYSIVIGAGGAGAETYGMTGGQTSAFGFTANGGQGARVYKGGAGGSGGGSAGETAAQSAGGSNGEDGASGDHAGGNGQGTTTYAFEDSTSSTKELYAGGGAGSEGYYNSFTAEGGDGGGGDTGVAGAANTGGGGGGFGKTYGAKAGGSGIVIIRNKRS